MLPPAMLKILILLLCTVIALLLWRHEGPGWLAAWPAEVLAAAAMLLALLILWKSWRRLRASIRDMND